METNSALDEPNGGRPPSDMRIRYTSRTAQYCLTRWLPLVVLGFCLLIVPACGSLPDLSCGVAAVNSTCAVPTPVQGLTPTPHPGAGGPGNQVALSEEDEVRIVVRDYDTQIAVNSPNGPSTSQLRKAYNLLSTQMSYDDFVASRAYVLSKPNHCWTSSQSSADYHVSQVNSLKWVVDVELKEVSCTDGSLVALHHWHFTLQKQPTSLFMITSVELDRNIVGS